MKLKYLIYTLFLFISSQTFSQNNNRILTGEYSTLSLYLSHELAINKNYDSCFVGVFNISFSLSENGDLKDYATSSMLPKNYHEKIKESLTVLKNKWDKEFLNFVSKKNKTIIQPVYLYVYDNCTYISKKKQLDSLKVPKQDSLLNLTLTEKVLFDLAKVIASLEETFSKANSYTTSKNKKAYQEVILLNPCTIIQKSPYRKPQA